MNGKLTENEIARMIVHAAYKVHTKLGPGLLESVYETVLAHELKKASLNVTAQVPIPILYDGMKLEGGFRADLVVENKVIVELKSVENLLAVHKKQLLSYLRLSGLKPGLLINFGAEKIKDGIARLVNGLAE